MSDMRDLLDDLARSLPVAPIDRAARALRVARRRRRATVITGGAVLAVTVLTFLVAGPLVARLETREQLGPAGVPNRVSEVPLHAPTVGPGRPLGQRASLLLGGVPHASGWFGTACCSLAVVGASSNLAAFLDLPGAVPAGAHEMPAHLSPDGRTVTYPTARGVAVLDLVDGSERTISPPEGEAVRQVLGWSGDRSWLLVATNASRSAAAGTRLSAVAADGSRWRTLAAPANWVGSSRAAALSPDGSSVAYVQAGELWLAPTQGAGRPRLLGAYMDNPVVTWDRVGAELIVAATGNGPDGVVHRGARPSLEVFDLPSGATQTLDNVGGSFDSANLLPGIDTLPGSGGLFVVSESGTNGILSYDSSHGRVAQVVVALPSSVDPAQVEVAVDLLLAPPRPAGRPSDPSRTAGSLAVALGLVAALVVPACLLLPRRRG